MTTIAEQLPTRFEFSAAQPRIYQSWLDNALFRSVPDPQRQPYTIVIPPPNVTGALHLGHALNNTLQDVLIRMRRMQGFNTLWMPGTDHAGIATQAVVERRLREEEGKTRHDLGREKLVERIWQWKDQYEVRILGQLKQLGCSCDWERTRFTFDDQCARAVRFTFFDLFQKQLIYRGKRLVNWDTFLQTAVSDDEVFSKAVQGHFWHLRYPVIDPQPGEPAFVVVATTRPETMLGDTAVAVHPDPAGELVAAETALRERLATAKSAEKAAIDVELASLNERQQQLLPQLILLRDMARNGRRVKLPIVDREIPLILDEWAKPALGSGCVKITPAHDPNDYLVGQRHKLPMVNVMNPDGTLNSAAGEFAGLTIKRGRERIVEWLEKRELIAATEEREIELPHSDRSKTPIEPYLADQWFVRMDSLAQSAMDAVSSEVISIIPARYTHGYLAWLSEKRDWPVSRQLWWGHQIPVWSRKADDAAATEELRGKTATLLAAHREIASMQIEPIEDDNGSASMIHVCLREDTAELEAALAELGYARDCDVLDTWFSSALWPHSTMGWPNDTPELDYYYPTTVLVTSRDIITLWVARMVLMSLNNTGKIPFHQVYVHPKILDGYGETMSKSKGNGVDPLDVIEKFGADALRFGMTHLTTETQDVRMPVQFECPHCQKSIEQTHKNRELPRIDCPSCNQPFGTQWAITKEDLALPRGFILSERFEVARNFVNKLWNAARFAMMNLDGYAFVPIDENQLLLEDRWMLSRMNSVAARITDELDQYRFSEAARLLYDLAWDEFCSFYLEIVKNRLAGDSRGSAQVLLAYLLDYLLRLLHPIMPFVTEEIWQHLSRIAPDRGLTTRAEREEFLITASWPDADRARVNAEIEAQFAQFQQALTGLRDIRAKQNIPPRTPLRFSLKCGAEMAKVLRPMAPYFRQMANAEMSDIGSSVAVPPIHAAVALPQLEIIVDLDGLIDRDAELARLRKEQTNLENQIKSKSSKLSNESFVQRAPADVVQRERDQLTQLSEQLAVIQSSLQSLEQVS